MKARFLFVSATCIALTFAANTFGSEAPKSEPSRYTVHLVKVDVVVLAERVALATGKTFIIDPKVKDLVSLETKKPVSASELYETFVRVLSNQGLRVTERRNGTILITPSTALHPAPPKDTSGFIDI